MDRHEATTADGRTLRYVVAGDPTGPLLVSHHGSPGSGRPFRAEVEGAERLGLRLASYSRPGFDGSTPQPGRNVAGAAADVAALLDALGADRFATYGWSVGGPHALACAALLPERCAAAATIAGAAPSDRPELEFTAGMGAGNVDEFGAAAAGRETLSPLLSRERADLLAVTSQQLADALAPHLSARDAQALDGELAAFLTDEIQAGLRPGPEGWIDDDLAFMKPWGFDVGAIGVPVSVWQGEDDLMVPGAHGRWLAANVPGAQARLLPEEGHLTLFSNRIGDVQAWLVDRL